MNDPLPQYIVASDKLRNTQPDQKNGAWVLFKDNRQYILPIVARYTVLRPTFADDGTATLDITNSQQDLSALAEKVLLAISDAKESLLLLAPEMLQDIWTLVRKLLLINYDYTNEEIASLIGGSSEAVSMLVSNIIVHLRKS